MLRVTFYSYKGGVGRTLALLNVAALLAGRGRRVVVVDLDLEAPGMGLSALTQSPTGGHVPGVSDLLLDRWASIETPTEAYAYPVMHERFGDNLRMIPAGTRAGEFAHRIPEFFRDLQGDAAQIFMLLIAEIETTFTPDYVFFDSRTGLADVAGVCTLELPEVVVAVCGLSEQNIMGMDDALEQMRKYRRKASIDVATLLVLSPVPREQDLRRPEDDTRQPSPDDIFRSIKDDPIQLLPRSEEHPLKLRINQAQTRLLFPLQQELPHLRRRFPRLERGDLFRLFTYDPWIPLRGELVIDSDSSLNPQYKLLADTLERIAGIDLSRPQDHAQPPPIPRTGI